MKEIKNLDMKQVIEEINKLAAIKKERALTEKENLYREKLKVQYLKFFRAGLEQQLQNTKVIDENGKDITPSKIKESKEG